MSKGHQSELPQITFGTTHSSLRLNLNVSLSNACISAAAGVKCRGLQTTGAPHLAQVPYFSFIGMVLRIPLVQQRCTAEGARCTMHGTWRTWHARVQRRCFTMGANGTSSEQRRCTKGADLPGMPGILYKLPSFRAT